MGAMLPPDRQELLFAGAGILWGAITFIRGISLWRSEPPAHFKRNKSTITMSLIGGFSLIVGCGAYLIGSVRYILR